MLFQKNFEKVCSTVGKIFRASVEGLRKGRNKPAPTGLRKGVRIWNLIALRNEAIDAIRERKYRKKHEVTFSDLSPQEENQLYTCDQYFVNDEAEKSFFVAGKEITAKQLADALHSLPEEKRQAVLLYYFFDMKDAEIAELMKIPRSTVQFRRTSSFELLKRFLEESR